MTLHFRMANGEEFDLELTDEQWAVIEAVRARDALTLDQWLDRVLEEFMATHPMISQTRTVQ